MSHYEQRLSEDLSTIRSALDRVTTDVVSALERSVKAVRDRDRDMLNDVVLDDLSINRQIRAIDALCHAFVARHLPAAGHLRFISSVLRLTVALERAGDYAVTISRVMLQLEAELSADIVDKIEELAELSWGMLSDAMHAFLEGNVELARATKHIGNRIDRVYDELFQGLIESDPMLPALQLASLLKIFGKIERFSDQAKNICEETLFVTTGELKAPRVFRMLFFDERNDLVSPLAAAIAWKQFPEAGVYSSAGWNPAKDRHPELDDVAERFTLDVSRVRPRKITELVESPVKYQVVVALNIDEDQLPNIPYHTMLRRWDIPTPSPGTPEAERPALLDAMVRELTAHIRSLMERLRGTNPA